MTGNPQAIGFLLTWVLGWAIGGALIDAGLSNTGLSNIVLGDAALNDAILSDVGVASLRAGSLATLASTVVWSLLWCGGGFWLYQRWTRSDKPKP